MELQKAIIIIAVSKYEGDLGNLPGTLVSAKRMRSWAIKFGDIPEANILEITDEGENSVNIAMVKQKINDFLGSKIIDRLIIYFAGHGMTATIANQFWLLPQACNDTGEGINVELFRRNLRHANIGGNNRNLDYGQLIMISDACRNTNKLATDFHGDSVFSKVSGSSKPLHQDRLFSSLIGDVSLHINAQDGKPPYCLFSQLVVEALEGQVPNVRTDKIEGGWEISNFNLAVYLDKELPHRSKSLTNKHCDADTITGIRPDDNIYSNGVNLPNQIQTSPAAAVTANTPMSVSLSTNLSLRQDNGIPTFRQDRYRVLRKMFTYEGEPPTLISETPFDTQNILVPKSRKIEVWKDQNFHMLRMPHVRGEPILIRVGGSWLIVPQYPNVTPLILESYPRDIFLIKFTPIDNEIDTILCDQFNRSQNRILRVQDALTQGDKVRYGKAIYPHYSVTAGYLYEFAGDQDNILRTAHYMAKDKLQISMDRSLRPIKTVLPFDLALLCANQFNWDGSQFVCADLSAVSERDDSWNPRARLNRPRYTSTKFKARNDIPVWGTTPMFRQGWDFLSSTKHLNIPNPIRELCSHVSGSTAPYFSEKGARLYSKYFNYEHPVFVKRA